MENFYPKVTVVTVVINAQDVIEKTINSVINQDYPNLEYVVIDGESQDDTK
ncbi:MAG: glycosyltransferase, partial [Cyanobacteria bacterium J06641_2]